MVKWLLIGVLFLAGCGNVYMSGEAKTAAVQSAYNAYEAYNRYQGEDWTKEYLKLNAQDWKHFVNSATKKDTITFLGESNE